MFQRQAPAWISKRLARYGRNPWRGPLFRLIWSDTRREWSLLHQCMWLKYPEDHCWILELWCPPAQYGSPESWYAIRDWEQGSPTFGAPVLGPYPARGDYEPVYRCTELSTSTAVSREVLELFCRLIEAGKAHTRSERWAAIQRKHAEAERNWQRVLSDYCDDKLSAASCRAALRFGPWSYRGQQRGPDNIRFDKSTKDLPAPVRRLPQGFGQMGGLSQQVAQLLKKKPASESVQ